MHGASPLTISSEVEKHAQVRKPPRLVTASREPSVHMRLGGCGCSSCCPVTSLYYPPPGAWSPSLFIMFILLELPRLSASQPRTLPTNVSRNSALFQEYVKVLTSDSMCGQLVHSKGSGFGENLFICYTSDTSTDCYTPDYAMDNLCESQLLATEAFHSKEVTLL